MQLTPPADAAHPSARRYRGFIPGVKAETVWPPWAAAVAGTGGVCAETANVERNGFWILFGSSSCYCLPDVLVSSVLQLVFHRVLPDVPQWSCTCPLQVQLKF